MEGPHQNQPLLSAGAAPEKARAALLLVHGRGATAASILSLADEFQQDEFLYLAPQAGGNTWYPYSFLSPITSNEPGLSSGLAAVGAALAQVEAAGIPPEHTILLGFSQGACLALEYAARNARRYGGVVGYSGGLIGPEGTPRDYPGAFDGTPVFLGCGVPDPHIPEARVLESAEVFRRLGGEVTARLYPRMGHTINADEIAFVQEMMAALIGQV
ncbi:phospholipase [Anaerolineae bacterium CFX8]|nr:phospholipase [Anaerolineae bacterium CFX8]